MGLLNPKNPSIFPKSHVMGAIFEPIKDDIKPIESNSNDNHFFSSYSQMDAPDNPNWALGQKTPGPDNMLLATMHNLLHKNSLASAAAESEHKGISKPDFEAAFRNDAGYEDTEEVAQLFDDLTTMQFEKPDLRKVRSRIGRD